LWSAVNYKIISLAHILLIGEHCPKEIQWNQHFTKYSFHEIWKRIRDTLISSVNNVTLYNADWNIGTPGLIICEMAHPTTTLKSTVKTQSCYLHILINHVCHRQTLRLLSLHNIFISLLITLFLFLQEYQWDATIKGNLLSSFIWGCIMTQIPAGQLAQRFGPKILLTGSLFFCSLFTMLMPVAAEVGDWGLLCGTRVIQGLAQVSRYFEPFFIWTAEYIKDKIFTQGINKNNFSDLFLTDFN